MLRRFFIACFRLENPGGEAVESQEKKWREYT